MAFFLLDLSSNNGDVNFRKVKEAGFSGVWLKATEGISYVDHLYSPNRLAALAAGLYVGAYHFARPDLHPHTPEEEAKNFCKTIGTLWHEHDLRPALDLETRAEGVDLVKWAREFNGYVRARLCAWPMFYSFPAYIAEMHPSLPIGGGLWLASWGANDGEYKPTRAPKPWKKILIHQYTSKGRSNGIVGHVDISRAVKLDPLIYRKPTVL